MAKKKTVKSALGNKWFAFGLFLFIMGVFVYAIEAGMVPYEINSMWPVALGGLGLWFMISKQALA